MNNMWSEYDKINNNASLIKLWEDYESNIDTYRSLINKLNNHIKKIIQLTFNDVFEELKQIGFHRYENDYHSIQLNPTGKKFSELDFEFNIFLKEDKSFEATLDVFNDFKDYPKREKYIIKNKGDVDNLLKTIKNSYSQYKPYGRFLKLNRILEDENNL